MAARVAAVLGALGVALLVAIVPTGAAVAAPESPVEILPPVAVGDGPFAVAVSPDGAFSYVLSLYDDELDVIDTATNTIVTSVPVTLSPLSVLSPSLVVHPDGRILVLDAGDSVTTDPAILEIDSATWQVHHHSLAVGAPWTLGVGFDLVLTPDGAKAYVSDSVNGLVLAVEVPPTAGPGAWNVTPIDVAGTTTPTVRPGSLAVAGGYLYILDLLGEDAGTKPTGAAVLRVADDVLEPTVITYTAPVGTTGGILDMPVLKAARDGATVLISAAAELDDGSGDYEGYFWTIPGGTIPGSATYLGEALGGEVAALTLAASGKTAYVVDCACSSFVWTLDIASGAGAALDLSAATDLDLIAAAVASPDDTRLFLTGYDSLGDSRLWQLSTVTDDVLTVTGPTTADQGGSVTLTATALDNSGNPIDVTSAAEFTSSVATDVISGNVVTFPHASPHTITATYRPLPSLPPVAVGAITVEVRAMIPPTGVEDPRPALGATAVLLLAGAALVLTRSRLRRA